MRLAKSVDAQPLIVKRNGSQTHQEKFHLDSNNNNKLAAPPKVLVLRVVAPSKPAHAAFEVPF